MSGGIVELFERQADDAARYLSTEPADYEKDIATFIQFAGAVCPITRLFEAPLITAILLITREFAIRMADPGTRTIVIDNIVYSTLQNSSVLATTAARVVDELIASTMGPLETDIAIHRLAKLAANAIPVPSLKFECNGTTLRDADEMGWQVIGAFLETVAFIREYRVLCERAVTDETVVNAYVVALAVAQLMKRSTSDSHPESITGQMELAEVMPGTVSFVQHYLCTLPCAWEKRYAEITWNVRSEPSMFLMYNTENRDVLQTGIWDMGPARRPHRAVYRSAMAYAESKLSGLASIAKWPDSIAVCSPAQVSSHWHVHPSKFRIYFYVHCAFFVQGDEVYRFNDPCAVVDFVYQRYSTNPVGEEVPPHTHPAASSSVDTGT